MDAYIEARNFDAATQVLDKAQSHDPLNPRVPQTREKIRSAERNWRAQQDEQETRDILALLARSEAVSDLQQRENALMDAQAKYPKSTDIRAALLRTREEMKRPAAGAAPSRSVDRREILQTVRLYAEAYEDLSQDKFLAVYPNATQRRLQTFSLQRKACRKQLVTYDESGIKTTVTDDGRVIVDIPVQYDCVQPSAGRRPPPSKTIEQMTLARQANGQWLIVAMAER